MLNKKIMIMTASIGHGHNQVAKVIKENLLKQNENLDIKIVDFMEVLESLFGQIIVTTYLKIIDSFPTIYHYLYYLTSKFNKGEKVKDLFAYRYKKRVLNIIQDYNPDGIIFTNPFLLVIVGYLKKVGKLNTYMSTIITDYTAHSIWINSSVNQYFVGNEELKDFLLVKGISSDKIEVSGIPVDDRFYEDTNTEDVLRELQLSKDVPIVLIMGGGLGVGAIEEVIDVLNHIKTPLQLIIVTGLNSSLRKRLEKKALNNYQSMKVLGFCNNIYELMSCSDLLISKSGGVTVTEAINKRLPILIVDPIPGQELENAIYLSKIGVAILIKDLNEIKTLVEKLLFKDKKSLEEMKLKFGSIVRPYSGKYISNKILKDIYSDVNELDEASII